MNQPQEQQPQYALVIVDRPPVDISHPGYEIKKHHRWKDFDELRTEASVKQIAGAKMLAENVWLIPLHDGLPFLGRLTDAALRKEIPVRILFLPHEPEWTIYPPTAP